VESDSSYYTPSNNCSCCTGNGQKGSEDKDCMVHRKTDCHHQLTKKEHQTNAPRPRDEQQDDATESRWLRISRRVYIISMLPPTFGNGTTGRLFAIAQITVRLYFCEGLNKTGTTTAFLKCRLWGHTACSKCGKNPKHAYEPVQTVFTRMFGVAGFRTHWSVLPLSLSLLLSIRIL
jgi:hypothetical protein